MGHLRRMLYNRGPSDRKPIQARDPARPEVIRSRTCFRETVSCRTYPGRVSFCVPGAFFGDGSGARSVLCASVPGGVVCFGCY
ncbi:hypothetical protein BJX70DRAFT_381863 [Aspergillus crustosus]